MRRRIAATALAVALFAFVGGLAACGSGDEPTGDGGAAVEGEPIEIAGLSYNVQITRFLNPEDTEDAEYLVGLPPPPPGISYLGVFLVIENQSGDSRLSATNYTVRDTLLKKYDFVESESPYALGVGADVPAEGQIPIPDSTAATGPNQGSLLIFPVAQNIGDNRPLRLEIQTYAGTGEVILDI
ncbi:MAG: hypothetical protein QOI10_285 [Solirubrobacterales bacterium]|nr:hypothetical protein [Solirubrobacterales bacterium]